MFGEDTCTTNGNLSIELLHNCDLMVCNGIEHYCVIFRSCVILAYIINDTALMNASSE